MGVGMGDMGPWKHGVCIGMGAYYKLTVLIAS
jgi:hypothetical protein